MTRDRELTYVAQIKAGAHGSFRSGPYRELEGGGRYREGAGSLSTYSDLERFFEEHGEEIANGAWIVDGREVSDSDAIHVSVHGPMVDADADLEATVWDGEHFRPVAEGDDFGAAVVAEIASNFGMGGSMVTQQRAAVTGSPEPGPFDSVPPGVLANYWREVGARIGRWYRDDFDGGRVVWES